MEEAGRLELPLPSRALPVFGTGGLPLAYASEMVVGEGVEPSRPANQAVSLVYKASPHSRCYPPKWRTSSVSSRGRPSRGDAGVQSRLPEPLALVQDGGVGEIRTHGTPFRVYTLSKRAR